MTQIALLPSVLGVRPGVIDAAEVLRDAGHDVHVVDYLRGEVFDDYATAEAFIDSVGETELLRRALEGVATLDNGFVVAGFSFGTALAEHVALHRQVSGAVLLAGAVAIGQLGATAWPVGVPVQVHYTENDPFREDDELVSFVASVRASGASAQTFDYPGDGHLFTDASLTDEYDAEATALLWSRVREFLQFCGVSPPPERR